MGQPQKLTPAEMLALANKALERHPPGDIEERRIDTPMRSALPFLRQQALPSPSVADSREYLRALLTDAYFCELDRQQQVEFLATHTDQGAPAVLKYSRGIGMEHSERLLIAYRQLWPDAEPRRADSLHMRGIVDAQWQQAVHEGRPSQRHAIILFLQTALHYQLALYATIGAVARDLTEKAVVRLVQQSIRDLSDLTAHASAEDANDPDDRSGS